VPTRSGGSGADAVRVIRVVYELEGVEDATVDQASLEDALRRAGEAMGEQSEAAGRAEGSTRSLSGAATEAGLQAILTQQRISALASGLSGLGSAIGSDSELGSTLGRMGQLAATGVSLGSMFGPQGAVVGGIIGGAIPAFQSLGEQLGIIARAHDAAAERAAEHARRIDDLAKSAQTASEHLSDLQQKISTRQQEDRLARVIFGEVSEMTPEEASLAAEAARRRVSEIRSEREARAQSQGAFLTSLENPIEDELRPLEERIRQAEARARQRPTARRGGGRGGGRRRADPLEELMERAAGGSDAVGFAAGLEGADVSGAPSAFDVEAADLQRQGRNRRFGGSTQAEIQAIDRLKREQEDAHNKQMARIQEQVDAWTAAGEKIGSTVYSAFTTAVSGQENFDVAMVKGFKSLAVQFGGQMVNEGIAALLTAAGNTVANPPVAATKAAEGAGKLALGIGLGAAGAAIPVPSSGGGEQARPPRLGPTGSEGASGGSVIVNMNAPAVVAGTRAELGREIGTTLRDARNRFGRVSL
jgi:hypothetical protein